MEDRTRIKTFRAQTKTLDDSHIEVVASTEAKDRDGDIIRVAGWDLKHFQAHPVLLTSHDYGSLRSQIGEWTDMKKRGIESPNKADSLCITEYFSSPMMRRFASKDRHRWRREDGDWRTA